MGICHLDDEGSYVLIHVPTMKALGHLEHHSFGEWGDYPADEGQESCYQIGGSGPGGGRIIHIYEDGTSGLEAALSDQSALAQRCSVLTDIANVDNIGTIDTLENNSGADNTPPIVAICDGTSAAGAAASYEWPNGQTDGFLPNKEELSVGSNQSMR